MHQNATLDISVITRKRVMKIIRQGINKVRDKNKQTKNINFDRCGNDNKVSNIID